MTSDERRYDIDRQIAEPLRRANVRLDDVHAARLGAGIEAAIDRRAGRLGRRRGRIARIAVVTLGLGAAAAAATVVAVRHVGRSLYATTPSQRPSAALAQEPRLLAPYVYSGTGAEEQTLDATRRLVARAGARVRATIGTRVRLTLVGPGELAVAGASEDADIELVLERGRLLVDYDGRGGSTLRVRSPGAVTTVVGTLFSVEALDKTTRVAVARGRVRTQGAAIHTIVAGAAWSTEDGAVERIPEDVAADLTEHDASPPPPVGEYGIVRVDAAPMGQATVASTLALDGRTFAPLPVVVRVPAGDHVLDVAGGQVRLDVTGGNTIRLDRDSALWQAPAPGFRQAPPADDIHAKPGIRRGLAWAPSASRKTTPANVDARPQAESAEDDYLTAEAAMRSGLLDDARRALEAVATRDPGGVQGRAALLDLARLTLEAGDAQKARRYLAQLPEPDSDVGLAEAAHHMRCRLEVKLGDDAEAVACLLAFRRRYPQSPHDAESLAVLASLARTCATMRPMLEEYLRVYPRGPFARDGKARLDLCAAGRPSP